MTIATGGVDALGFGLFNFLVLGYLRQLGRFVEAAVIHAARFDMAVPADLLDAVIKLVAVAVGIEQIGVPVGTRHVAAGALLLDVIIVEPFDRVIDFAHAADLPGNLIDRHARLFGAAQRLAHAFGEKHHGVVIAAVAGEVTVGVAETGDLLRTGGALGIIHHV